MDGILCKVCNLRPATTHLTEVAWGNQPAQILHICSSCIRELGLDFQKAIPSVSSVLSKQAHGPDEEDMDAMQQLVMGSGIASSTQSSTADDTCQGCGMGWQEFANHNRFGCEQDYVAFEERLAPVLEQIHGESEHAGRRPGNHDQATAAAQRLDERRHLERALKLAVDNERFEEAARLRDDLQQLDEAP